MILTILRLQLQRLFSSRIDQCLVFVVPIAFFSIFAIIFAKGIGSSTPTIKVLALDRVDSEASHQLCDELRENPSLRLLDCIVSASDAERNRLQEQIQLGRASVGLVIERPSVTTLPLRAELLIDPADPVAPQLAAAVIEQTLQQIAHSHSAHSSGEATTAAAQGFISQAAYSPEPSNLPGPTAFPLALVSVEKVVGGDKANPVVSIYAAGIAVMFLLFGASNAGGTILEERESGTFERLMCTRLTVDQILMGKWVYQTLLGLTQITIMFFWGQIVFGIELTEHLVEFFAVSIVTAGAASSLGLLLATICSTRSQLNGISVVLILCMSALGGSMVPRYLMSDDLRTVGQFTFNAWAVDAYEKVFWRDLGIDALATELGVLTGCGMVLLLSARAFASRWETA